jgi:hypothetical protein
MVLIDSRGRVKFKIQRGGVISETHWGGLNSKLHRGGIGSETQWGRVKFQVT